MARGDGIAQKGHTKGKNLGDSGPSVGMDNLKKGNGGKTNEQMLKMGRNMAKIASQKGK